MNRNIRISVPKSLNLYGIIQKQYTELYRQYKQAHPSQRDYTVAKLRQNICAAYDVVRQTFSIADFHPSRYTAWHSNGWYDLYYAHWCFAVAFSRTKGGVVFAVIQDAHYEGYHHNDTIGSKPYDESVKPQSNRVAITENDLRNIVRECVRRIVKEHYEDNSLYGWNAVERTARNGGADMQTLQSLRKSYDKYGEECAKRGQIPNNSGFKRWASHIDAASCERGNGMVFPDYWAS